jgi:RHS repeat-associated protein
VKGQVTGSMTRILDATNGNWTKTVTYYDNKYRPIQTISSNIAGGYDDLSFDYDFPGKVVGSARKHKGHEQIAIEEKLEYDNAGRLAKHLHKTGTREFITLTENVYNEIGELVTKKLHDNYDNVQYKYNIRGWLTNINDINTTSKRFSMQLKYNEANTTGVAAQYNGNIAELVWRNGTGERQVYGYAYDHLNRLTQATYKNLDNAAKNNSFNVSGRNGKIQYDLNGNILYLSRQKYNVGILDDLEYKYDNGGNQLTRVIDQGNKDFGFRDKDNTVDYEYDKNDNLKLDRNKGITSIEYNHMNLPKKIIKGTEGNIGYIYDAAGIKQKKLATQGQSVMETLYIGGIQYIKDVGQPWKMDFIQTVEGRVINPTSSPVYQYDLKDHLGNSRYMFSENGSMVSSMEGYYPFGMAFETPNEVKGAPAHKYLYQGKEYQNELGLDTYDFEWRMYDPAIGRTFQLDPMAVNYYSLSPYSWVANNPLKFIDPDGMDVINADEERRNQRRTARDNTRTARDNARNEHNRNMAANNANANMSKKEMKNAGVWDTQKALNRAERQLNNAERQFNSAEQAYQQTQGAIDALRTNDPATFNRLDALTYNGRVIDVHVTSSATLQDNQHGAQTVANFSAVHNRIYTLLPGNVKRNYTFNAITVRLERGVLDPDVKFAHEAGHIFRIVRNPATYFRNFRRGIDCQDPANRNLDQVQDAMDVQENYQRLRGR